MKRFTFYLVILALFCAANLFATDVQTYVFKDDLTTDPGVSTNSNYAGTAYWGFDNAMTTSTWAYDATNKAYQFRLPTPGAATTYFTTRTLASAITQSAIDNKMTIQTIVKFYTTGRGTNPLCLYFADSNGKIISGITFYTVTKSTSATNYQIARATSFNSTAITAAPANYAYPTTADFNGVSSSATAPITVRITFVLDFSTKTLDYTCENGTFNTTSRVFTASGTPVTSTAQAFIDNTATDFKTFYFDYVRASAATAAAPYGFDMYFMGIQTLQTVSTANVNINYYDADSPTTLIKTVALANQKVDDIYTATPSDKVTFTKDNFYYTYSSMSLDAQTVLQDGSTHVDILMKKYPVISATYTWTGAVDGIWNELNGNFTDGTNTLGYQPGNAVVFPAGTTNKTITTNDNFDLGAGDFSINSDGYSFQGVGTLTGTGKLNVNLSGAQTASLGITNSLTGRTQIAGGTITLAKTGALGANVDVNGETTFIPTAATGTIFPATVFNAASTISCGAVPASFSSISSTATSKVSVSASSEYSTTTPYAFDFGVSSSLLGELELNGTGTENKFGITTGYANAINVTLKGSAFLFLDVSHGSATTINLSNLNGDSNTKIGWGRASDSSRDITWNVGSANLNSTYAGTITNIGGYNAGLKTGNNTHFVKVGTGILTFSGTATSHNGSFTVSGGELKVTGAIGLTAGTTTMNVTSGTLSAQNGGHITAGTLNVSSGAAFNVDATSLATLTTVNVVTNGTAAGQLTLPNGTTIPTLNITSTATPANGTSIQVINATDPSTIVYTNTPVVPVGYNFNTTTGVLTYDSSIYTSLNSAEASATSKLTIYASNDKIYFEAKAGERVEVYNAVGMKLTVSNAVDGLNSISITAKGVMMVKVGNRTAKVVL